MVMDKKAERLKEAMSSYEYIVQLTTLSDISN